MASRRERVYNDKIKEYKVKKNTSNAKLRQKYDYKLNKYEKKLRNYKERKGDINYRSRQYSIVLSGFSTLIGVVLVYVLFNFLVDPTFQFSFIGFVDTLSNMPLISLTNIGSWDFPNWLDWLEPLAKGLSILGASIANIAVIAVWLILLLFGIPV